MASQLAWYTKTLREYLSQAELEKVMRKNNWLGAWEIVQTWLWISFALVLPYYFFNPFTVIISLFIIGGKQLACAIIMHDTSHDSLFTSRKVNLHVGNWFGAFPILHHVNRYRPYHTQHHIHTGTDEDPDLGLVKGYPTSVISMARKIGRDLAGASGVKAHIAVLAFHFGYLQYHLGGMVIKLDQKGKPWYKILWDGLKSISGPLASNLIIFAILAIFFSPWLYLLWIGAMLTTYNFSLRVRSIAEHSMSEDRTNPHRNTRTTYANFFEVILFAPLHVNYHAEHHLCMGAPSYNLPYLHSLLKERGYFNEGKMDSGYWSIVKKAASQLKTEVAG